MDFARLVGPAENHAQLAALLQKYLGALHGSTATAVRDALGLWHTAPETSVLTAVPDFFKPVRNGRIAFLITRDKARKKHLARELKKTEALLRLKLETIDLAEKLRRFALAAESEDRQMKKRLQTTRQKAQAEFERKLNLFSHYSHDLKTPFSTLITSLENIVLEEEKIPPKLRLKLETIRGAIYAVLRTTGQSLDAARILTRQRRATLIPYNFSDFVTEIAEVYTIIFESYGLKLKTEISAGIPAEIDPIQMEKILNNLLNNALKHNIPGGLAHIALKENRGKIELVIRDTGLGLNPAGEKVKDRNPWRLSSHGYGLEIVKELVRANRGRLKFRSEGGVGTVVTVLLPAVPELKGVLSNLRRHNFQTTLHEVEFLANERTRLSRRRRAD